MQFPRSTHRSSDAEWSPDIPGCAAAGETEEETARNLSEALAEHLRIMREIGEDIPEPTSSVSYVEVAA